MYYNTNTLFNINNICRLPIRYANKIIKTSILCKLQNIDVPGQLFLDSIKKYKVVSIDFTPYLQLSYIY